MSASGLAGRPEPRILKMPEPTATHAGAALREANDSVLTFGGLSLGLHAEVPLPSIGFAPSLEPFRSKAPGPVDLEIELRFSPPREADLDGTLAVFDSDGLWQLRADAERSIFVLRGMDGGRLYRMASFDHGLTRGTIVSDLAGKLGARGPLLPDPLEYPLGEALTVSLLAAGRGLLVHALGLELDGRGFLLAGHSGAGKSTLARLANGRFRVLNDDRIVVRSADGVPWIHGTPWHGDCSEVSATGAPLTGIWIIEHGTGHRTVPLGGGQATAELLARCFLPLWSAPGMEFTLSFASELVARVPCVHLDFTPDAGALDEVLR
jgi:hypothetical protein